MIRRSAISALVVAAGLAAQPARACPRGGGATAGVTGRDRTNLGAGVNSWFSNCEAQVSADGRTLYFNYHHGASIIGDSGGGVSGVYRSRWDGSAWSEPELLVEGGSMPTVTRDESRVFFGLGPGMQVIERTGDTFGPPRPLQWEGATPQGMGTATVSADGNRLVLNGNSDLYLSRRNPATDTWSTPEKLGLPISGSGIEWHPFLTYDGTRLLYTTTSPEIIGEAVTGFEGQKMVEARWDEATQSFGAPRIIGEFGCSMSETEDGKELYYGGRFEGGRGALDLWTEKAEGVTREPVEARPAAGPPAGSRWCSLGRLPGAVSVGAVVATPEGALLAVSSDGAVSRLASGDWTAVHSLTSTCLAHLMEDKPMVGAVALRDGTVLATSPDGIARSTDGGFSWSSATLPGGITGARALSAGADGTVYAGTGDGQVLASEDGGASFWLRGDLQVPIRALAVDVEGTVYAAGEAPLVSPGPGGGGSPVQRSADGGRTFEAVSVTSGGGERSSLVMAYSVLAPGGGALFAGVWMHGVEDASGVLRFADGALSPTSPIPGAWQAKRATALLEVGAVLYAGLSTHEAGELVFASGDSGESWVSTGNLAPAREVFALAALSDGTVVAGTAPFGELFRLRASADDPCLPLPGGEAGSGGGGGEGGGVAGTGATGEESGCGCATGNPLSLAALLSVALGLLGSAGRRAR